MYFFRADFLSFFLDTKKMNSPHGSRLRKLVSSSDLIRSVHSRGTQDLDKTSKAFEGPIIEQKGIHFSLLNIKDIKYIQKIGEGGQGEVWKALVFGQKVAVKKLKERTKESNFVDEIVKMRYFKNQGVN